MPTQECTCGARYRFPESAVGKRAKCQQCGAVLTLQAEADEGPIPLAKEPTASASPPLVSVACLPSAESAGRLGQVIVETAETPPSFWRSLRDTLLFPASPGNLATAGVVWFVLLIPQAVKLLWPLMTCFILPLQVLIAGWYAAYRFSLIEDAAALAVMTYFGLGTQSKLVPALQLGFGGILRDAPPDVLLILLFVYGGMFLWPMIVLCVALGGFGSLSRPDLIIFALCDTFPVYFLTACIVLGADLLGDLPQVFWAPPVESGAAKSIGGLQILLVPVATATSLYFEIVAMRAIGLYYYHFKHQFRWSWE